MDNQLQYDPRTKQYIRDSLISYLYKSVQSQLEQKLNALIIRNSLLGGYSHKSFVHRGITYSCDNAPAPRKANRVIPQLVSEFEAFLKERKELVDQEIPYTSGYLIHVLNQSDSLQDYMKLLPEVMHPTIKAYAQLCPCQTSKLSDSAVKLIRTSHQHSINLLKQRMVKNLLM